MHFKVSVAKAIEAAEKNLQDHIKELADAAEVWTEKATAALGKFTTALAAQKDAVDREGVKASNAGLRTAWTEVSTLFTTKPVDNRANYSRFIGALKLTLENEPVIEMDEYEYDQLFNDNWDWRIASKTANSMYSKG